MTYVAFDLAPIPGYDDYFVSKSGRIFSTKRGSLREMKLQDRGNYLHVNFSVDSKVHLELVHRCVLAAWGGEGWKPYPEFEVRHLNGDGKDNRLENLMWGTCSENYRDMRNHGTLNVSKLTEDQVIEIRERYAAGGITQSELSKEYPVTRTGIQAIVNGRTWADVGGPTSTRNTNGERL